MQEPITFMSLDEITVAKPCHAEWDKMQGDDSVRFCQTCAKNVYNLSAMNRTEAEALVQAKEGKMCVRFYQREDGTLLTDDCPVGIRLVKRKLQWVGTAVAALLAAVTSCVAGKVSAAPQKSQKNNNTPTTVAKLGKPVGTPDKKCPRQLMGRPTPPPTMGEPALRPEPTPVPTSTPAPKPTPTVPPHATMGMVAVPRPKHKEK